MKLTEGHTLSPAQRRWSMVAMLVFLVYTLLSFGVYCARTLKGDPANHILAAEMFGTPEALKARGIKPMYAGAGVTGWDGQFYYYMSNDILARKDTPAHIDSPSYRYQRIGLSLYAKTMATLTGRDWVSPQSLLVSYFLLICAATWVGGRLLARFGGNPMLILLWSLSIGTQVTLFNALPDACADAFLILALAALFSGRTVLSVIPFAMSALSREVYAVFPALILLFTLVDGLRARLGAEGAGAALAGALRGLGRTWWLLVPCIVIVAWQVYVISHFGVRPSDQAVGILGAPFASWYRYFISGAQGAHLLGASPRGSYGEALSLAMFALVLAAAFLTGARLLRLRALPAVPPALRGIGAAVALFAMLYACFGDTVMMHYTGYFKAATVFFFLLPLLLCAAPLRRAALAAQARLLLVLALAATSVLNLGTRIMPYQTNGDRYTRMSTVTETGAHACFGEYSARIKVNAVTVDEGSWITRLFGRATMVVNLDLTNTSAHPFVSTRGAGSVFMGYHWVDDKNQVVIDGERSAIPGPLLPGQTANVNVYSLYPTGGKPVSLKLSPVQEGCTWFYLSNPAVTEGFSYRIAH